MRCARSLNRSSAAAASLCASAAAKSTLGERRLGGVEPGAEHAAAGSCRADPAPRRRTARPRAPRRGRAQAPARATGAPSRGLATRALQQLVEAVEVEVDEIGREPVRLRLGDHEPACALTIVGQAPTEDGDERLDRGGGPGTRLGPEKLRDPLGGHEAAPSGEEDLEHLLRPHAAQIARPQQAARRLDREWAEQAESRPAGELAGTAPADSGAQPSLVRRRDQRTVLPSGRTTSHRPPNSTTSWHSTWSGFRSPT